MSFTDPISDMITRIRNAQMRLLTTVKIPNSKFYYIIPDYFKKHLDYKALILSRINFNLPKKEKVCSRFHVDETYPCKTALFYINTTNATTIFENGKKVKGIENTLVIFDSMINHKVQFNTDGKERYVINFNYF